MEYSDTSPCRLSRSEGTNRGRAAESTLAAERRGRSRGRRRRGFVAAPREATTSACYNLIRLRHIFLSLLRHSFKEAFRCSKERSVGGGNYRRQVALGEGGGAVADDDPCRNRFHLIGSLRQPQNIHVTSKSRCFDGERVPDIAMFV